MISVRLDLHRCRKGRELGRGDLVDGCGHAGLDDEAGVDTGGRNIFLFIITYQLLENNNTLICKQTDVNNTHLVYNGAKL